MKSNSNKKQLLQSHGELGESFSRRALSRDEMNLAEFPLTVLATRSNPALKTLEFTDSVCGKNGEIINRNWIITGADKFGLPTSSDDEVLLGLLKLTVDDGVQDRKVYFTRYELLKILRWSTEGRSYGRLQKALDRLSGVRIKATNAFYDNDSKTHSTRNFGLIDEYEINHGKDSDARPSFFVWSDVLFKSFQVGFIKKLDLDFYLDLESAVAKRLYRYLDKHFWYRSVVRTNLFTLAHEKIGVSRNYQYASSLKQQLDPAFEELVSHGFLSGVTYEGKGKNTEVIVLAARGLRVKATENEGQIPEESRKQNQQEGVTQETIQLLVQRGLSEKQVLRLVAGKPEEMIQRIQQIVKFYDRLLAAKSHLVSKNPLGFLYRAVENPFAFSLPNERNLKEEKRGQQETLPLAASPRREGISVAGPVDRSGDLEARYLVFRKQQIDLSRKQVSSPELQGLYQSVKIALRKLQGLISETRFQEAIEHGVDEKLAKLRSVPDFQEWIRQSA